MSKKNLATTTLIAAGLLIASVPVLANDNSDHHSDRSNATVTASQSYQRESGSDRRADRPDREQRENVYGGQVVVPSLKGSRSSAKSTVIPVFRADSREHGNNHN